MYACVRVCVCVKGGEDLVESILSCLYNLELRLTAAKQYVE